MNKRLACLTLLILLLAACANGGATSSGDSAALPAPRPLITLQPTFTPPATAGPLPTITPPPLRPTAVPNTPIPFGDTAVELHYQIPALSLNRRLQGSVASEIIAVDETTGISRQRSNQAGIMLELSSALPEMTLEPLPEGCDTCVQVAYELPNLGLSETGWLQDPVLLASIENYLTAALGPHFPPDTVIGLRRSASPYAPASSIAVTADGRVWTWLATEPQISPPTEADPARPELALLANLSLADLQTQYAVECLGRPLETLYLKQGDTSWQGKILCPEMALPQTLLPLYARLDQQLAVKTADVTLPQPAPLFPLNALMEYRRADGAQLTLLADSTLIGLDTAGTTYTGTLTTTQPISLTTALIQSNLLQPGLETFNTDASTEAPHTVLVVRGPTGLLDGQWVDLPDNVIFAELDALLAGLIVPETAVTPAAKETAVATPTIEIVPTP